MLGSTTVYDYGFRIYNPSIAKFLSVDPLAKDYAMLTPYQFASNTPIIGSDLDGKELKIEIFSPWFLSKIEKAITDKDVEKATMLAMLAMTAEAKNDYARNLYGAEFAATGKLDLTKNGISVVSKDGKEIFNTNDFKEVEPVNIKINGKLEAGQTSGDEYELLGGGVGYDAGMTIDLVSYSLEYKDREWDGYFDDIDPNFNLKASGKFGPMGLGLSSKIKANGSGELVLDDTKLSANVWFYEWSKSLITGKEINSYKVASIKKKIGPLPFKINFTVTMSGGGNPSRKLSNASDSYTFDSDATRVERPKKRLKKE